MTTLKYKTSVQSNVGTSKIASSPDWVYLNIQIINSTQIQSFFASNPHISFAGSMQFPIVNNPSDYLFFIDRFSCEAGMLLPIWCPEIIDNQTNPNLCATYITLSVIKNGTTYKQSTNMIYIPENPVNIPPNTSLVNDTLHYYYVYTFSHIVYLFNNMLEKCFTDLQTQTGQAFTTSCPFMTYDAPSGLFSLYFDTTGEQFTVKFDSNLYNMFNSFYFRNTNELVISGNNGTNVVSLNAKTYNKITQDFISTSTWSPVDSLVFTTTKIPIVPEQSIQPLTINEDSNLFNVSSTPQKYQKIITDISLPVDKSSD